MPKLLITKNSSNNKKLQIINSTAGTTIRSSTYIRDTVLPILRSSITNFYNYSYDGGSSSIYDGGGDMYDGGNLVYLNGALQTYNTESANTFCYASYPFIFKTTQTSNFTLNVQGNYGSDGSETKYQYQQDFDYQGRKFSIYISESTDLNDPSIVECFVVIYPDSKPTINFTYTESFYEDGNETVDVSNLNGQSVTAFYLLISTYPAYQIGSSILFDALKTFVVNSTTVSYSSNSVGKKLRIKAPLPAGIPVASTESIIVSGISYTDLHGTYSKSAWQGGGGGVVSDPVGGTVYYNPDFTGGDRNGAAIWFDGTRWRFTAYNDNNNIVSSSILGLSASHIPLTGWLAGTSENYNAGLASFYAGTITITAA